MKQILVPLDLSDTSSMVVAAAAELAAKLQCGLALLHVVEPVATYVPVGASMDVIAPPPATLDPQDTSTQDTEMEQFAIQARQAGCEVETIVMVGLAVDEILSHAETREVPYIVLGSHGHGALYHLFAGSVVTGVLKRAQCPVVVVPAGKRKKKE